MIENFILHYTHDRAENGCDEMYKAAKDYIKEDHINGENMSEEDNIIFTIEDMRKAFVSGSTSLDFFEWIKNKYSIEYLKK